MGTEKTMYLGVDGKFYKKTRIQYQDPFPAIRCSNKSCRNSKGKLDKEVYDSLVCKDCGSPMKEIKRYYNNIEVI